MKIKKSIIAPGLILLKFENQYECCSTFMRVQEFYESPMKQIRGKYFTLEKFMDAYAKLNGNFTYTSDWVGFNVPGHVVDKFFKLFHFNWHDFLDKELKMFDLLEDYVGEMYYIIGVYEDWALDHEICHGLYYLRDDYREQVKKMVKALPKYVTKPMTKKLLELGYSDSEITTIDEINAYLSDSNKKDLTAQFGKGICKQYEKVIVPFKKLFQKFLKSNKII